jgi:transcriptional regulator with XRE-family HTH domain
MEVQMAKINVHPRPGALFELLKKKALTQEEAKKKTHTDRKTLLKINRGEEVKLETLQKVATKLGVTEDYLRQPQALEVTDNGDVAEPGTIMLRKLDAPRLEELLAGASRVKWHLNAKIRDDDARKFLEDFETAVDSFRKQNARISQVHREIDTLSLRDQLDRLAAADDITARLEQLAAHGVVLLGADYLFWDCDSEDGEYEYHHWTNLNYSSSRVVLLSVESGGTQSRRTPVFQGSLPPRFAPDVTRHGSTTVTVNGVGLPTLDEAAAADFASDSDTPSPRTLDDDNIPF